jgi:hypothetical protein
LGAETDGTNQWTGKIRLLAFYNDVLTAEQIQQNFDAGVGQKFNLLFKIGHMDDDVGDVMPDLSYIWFSVSEYDDFSYLFTSPQFIVLDPSGTGALTTTLPGTVNIKGIKLGMNGKEADVGQVFANLNTDVTESPQSMIATKSYDFGDGVGTTAVPVIGSGTIVAKQNGTSGSNADQFFLSFEEIAGKTGLSTDPALITFSPDTFPAGSAYVVGLRTFDELNASMAQVTGVNPTTIQTTFTNLKQQLPSKEDMAGFLASMQMSIANLAGAYCQALVEDDTKRASYFGVPESFFTTNPGTVDSAFGTGLSANKTAIVNALVTNMVGTSLNIQPNPTAIRDALIGSDGNSGLYGSLQTTCATDGCTQNAARVRTVVKGMCMAVLGSAAISEQ